ncbi:MAG: alpha/beta fold hydrolase [Bacteroidetes bacterium]|nr:MAG: alpha/beta fold hydrolase [Bacteroidota bacterium]
MKSIRNAIYEGADQRSSLIDLEIPDNYNGKLLLFAHGYMGFKDWGAWNLMQAHFSKLGYAFCKFNFSHNGGTIINGIDFPDLEAFSRNTYSYEVLDLLAVLDHLEKELNPLPEIHLIGHSRGGGIVLLCAQDHRVRSIITLAAISSISKRFSDQKMIEQWEAEGIRYHRNQRTLQDMPHRFEQVLDFRKNADQLNIQKACQQLQKPTLIIHGAQDTSVPVSEGEDLSEWLNSSLQLIPDTDHVFGAKQPWTNDELPAKLLEACHLIERFLA